MKKITKLIFLFFLITLFRPISSNASNNEINVYLFYGRECPSCLELKDVLDEIKEDYPNLNINMKFGIMLKIGNYMNEAATILDTKVTGVPFTVIGTKVFKGYSSFARKGELKHTIEIYSKVASYKDPVGEMLGVVKNSGTLTYEDIVKASDDGESHIFEVPLVGPVAAKDLSLPIIYFNRCYSVIPAMAYSLSLPNWDGDRKDGF